MGGLNVKAPFSCGFFIDTELGENTKASYTVSVSEPSAVLLLFLFFPTILHLARLKLVRQSLETSIAEPCRFHTDPVPVQVPTSYFPNYGSNTVSCSGAPVPFPAPVPLPAP